MPIISVVIPCYNVKEFLPECLDSVLNQTFKDFEIICVEDCSTDGTKDILNDYASKHKNITVIYNNNNCGLAIARNIGVDRSQGTYIYFLDSDDTISVDCLQVLYNEIVNNDCDIVMGAIKVYPHDINNKFCKERCDMLQDWVKFEPFRKLQISWQHGYEYYEKLYCCAVNKLYKKSFITNNNIRFINKKCCHEDNGFWLKILACNLIISGLANQTYFYRIRNQSITEKMDSDKRTHISDLTKVLMDALTFCKEKHNKVMWRFIHNELYKLKKHWFTYFVWNKYEKRFKLLRCPIFGLKLDCKTQKIVLKILGIRIYKWKKRNME